MNGGLSALLLIEAAIRQYGRPPVGLDLRNVSPLFVDRRVTLAGTVLADGKAAIWAANPDGALAVSASFF